MEDHRRFILVDEEELTEDVENDHREEAYSRIGTDDKQRHRREEFDAENELYRMNEGERCI